jgi:hypothetical protein
MKNIFHKHKWIRQASVFGNNHVCKCGAIQTLLYDWITGKSIWQDGLVTRTGDIVLILAGNLSEFRIAKRMLLDLSTTLRHRIIYATQDNIRGLRYADVYFIGTWYENPEYQSEVVTSAINHLLHT